MRLHRTASDQALTNTVTPGYFRTMGIPLLDGEDFGSIRWWP